MSSFISYEFPLVQVLPDMAQICEYLHLTEDDEDPAYAFIKQRHLELQQEERSIGGYCVVPIKEVNVSQGEVLLENGLLQCGKQVAAYLKDSAFAALFVCTAGMIFTRLTREHTRNDEQLEAYLTDALGSLAVENAMDRIQNLLEEKCQARGWNITNRYSPGYCNWPLTDQRALFSMIGENPTGVSLSDSCLMSPIKSVSGIIGLGPESKKRPYGCAICQNKTCIYRRVMNKQPSHQPA